MGAELIGDVVMVDQSSIGRTTRSNPASYVGAFDAIRKLFAKLPEARERKYTAGTFSFNSGNGRCPGCGGNGFEHVEMQFLSDVYLRCPDCNGRRYRAEILEIRLSRGGSAPLSIADVLDLTVSEALKVFCNDPEVCLRLAPLAEVGLDYLRLGQPVPTLSGGEAQRLKLSGHLAENAVRTAAASGAAGKATRRGKGRSAGAGPRLGSLFLFDEPTTGLHFDDVAKLLRAFRRLIEAGHSLLVIEHNLDVVRAADWIIDLGPEGGDAGGTLVGAGTPENIMRLTDSHTGRALLESIGPSASFGRGVEDAEGPETPASSPRAIEIRGAREHNLKDIDVDLGRNRFTVITGVSGSGKSTLAFDILFAEGQRRYLESLNAYARQFVQPASRPDVDAIFGIPPTVAIEQRTSRGGRKSTVATLTEIYHFLRLLYVKLGVQYCPDCRARIEPQSTDAIAARLLKEYRGRRITLLAPLIVARKGLLHGARQGHARAKASTELRVDGELMPTAKWPRLDRFVEHSIELPVATTRGRRADRGGAAPGARAPRSSSARAWCTCSHPRPRANRPRRRLLHAARLPELRHGLSRARPAAVLLQLQPRLVQELLRDGLAAGGVRCRADRRGSSVAGRGRLRDRRALPLRGLRRQPAQSRGAQRAVSASCSIAELTAFAGRGVRRRLAQVQAGGPRARDRARSARGARELALPFSATWDSAICSSTAPRRRSRAARRSASVWPPSSARTCRGCATCSTSRPSGCIRATTRCCSIRSTELRSKGNTLVVVEHDEDTIRRADHVIDLGPGAGARGGRVVAQGTAARA